MAALTDGAGANTPDLVLQARLAELSALMELWIGITVEAFIDNAVIDFTLSFPLLAGPFHFLLIGEFKSVNDFNCAIPKIGEVNY